MKLAPSLALALAAVLAPAAQAQLQQFCPPSQSIPLQTTNWQIPLSFQRFDPALGVLQRVEYSMTAQVEVGARFESLDARPTVVTLTRAGQVILSNPSNTGALLTSNPGDMFSESVSAFDGVIDFGGTSGRTYPPVLFSEMSAGSTMNPADLAQFTGPAGNPGTVMLPASGAGNSTATGPGNIITAFTTRAGVTVTVCYFYVPDCNQNGIPDNIDIQNGAPDLYGPTTCVPDGIPDSCQPQPDCDTDGIPDRCEILAGAPDVYGPTTCVPDGIPDFCQPQPDCDFDGIPNRCEILAGAPDQYGPTTCVPDGIPDSCQPQPDCDSDGIPNRCEILAGAPDVYGPTTCVPDGIPDSCQPQPDCDTDGIPDRCEILAGAPDLYGPTTCVPDGIPDSCQPQPDCDTDGIPDRCEILAGAPDLYGPTTCVPDGIPDSCQIQPDCDADGIPDRCEILAGAPDTYGTTTCVPDGIPDSCQPQPDCDTDGIPDRCEIQGGAPDLYGPTTCVPDGIPDSCQPQPDCDTDGIPDRCEIQGGAPDVYGPTTCVPDGIPDSCQPQPDCDSDGIPNRCEILAGAPDLYGPTTCVPDGIPDSCQPQPDCDTDGIPDRCEIQGGAPDLYGPTTCVPDGIPDSCQPQPDCDSDGIPDRCEIGGGTADLYGPGTCVPDGIPDVCQFEPDCDADGIPDRCEIQAGAPDLYGLTTCTPDGIPDSCQPQPDCDTDGIPDRCEIQGGAPDIYGPTTCVPDGIPDSCQPQPDCDSDGIPNRCEILAGAPDLYGPTTCVPDGIPDSCQPQPDCDTDGIPDRCEIQGGAPDLYGPTTCVPDGIPDSCQPQPDCDTDGIPDRCEIAAGAADIYGPIGCSPDGIPDICQPRPDCDQDGIPDRCEIAAGAADVYGPNICVPDGIPDSCQPQPDCDSDGIPNRCEIQGGAADQYGPTTCVPDGIPDSCQPQPDCDTDGIPDRCEIQGGGSDVYGPTTCVPDGIPDDCQPQPDCDGDGIPDRCEIQAGAPDVYGPTTCVPDGIPDSCQPDPDCDSDGVPDRCEIAGGAADAYGPTSCAPDGIPDVCQPSPDCDGDGVPDRCEIEGGAADAYGPSSCAPDGVPDVCQPEPDCDADGLPDRCELGGNDCDQNGVPDDCQPDCDSDGIPDACEILTGAPDVHGVSTCVPDGIPDSCQPQSDCDSDGIPDFCEILAGAPDADNNGIPDNCQADCCEFGRPRVLTFLYTGESCAASQHTQAAGKVTCSGDPLGAPEVRIRISDSSSPTDASAAVFFDGSVLLNAQFSASASAAGETSFATDSWAHIFSPGGVLLQTIKFHTSCSQPLAVGNQFGSLLLTGCIGKDQPVPGDCCPDGAGRPRVLRLRYTGESCAATMHNQAAGKVTCSGDPLLAPEVRVRVSDSATPTDASAAVFFDGTVLLGAEFDATSAAAGEDTFSTDSWIHVFSPGGVLLQTVKFHTSCSQPLAVGDQYGAFELTGCSGDNVPIPGDCCPDGSGRPRVLMLRYTGDSCAATSHNQAAGKVTCSGDPLMAPEVRVRVSDSSSPTDASASVFFDGNVLLGAVLTASANAAGEDTFATNSWIHVFSTGGMLLQTVLFHTSCSQPLAVGDQYGAFELTGCSSEDRPIPGDCCPDGAGRPRALTMRYTGESCAATSHNQAAGKVTCSGDPLLAPEVRVRLSNNSSPTATTAAVFFDDTVLLGAEFTGYSNAGGLDTFPTDTWAHVFSPGGVLLQTIKFHTSCSQPLAVGDQYGSLELTGCTSEKTPLPGDLCDGGRPRQLSMLYTGDSCAATSHSQDANNVSCSGDPLFAPLVRIRVSNKSSPTDGGAYVYFDGPVALGGVFYPDAANANRPRMEKDTWVHIFSPTNVLLQTVKFRTYCSSSSPLYAGDQFGAVQVLGSIGEDDDAQTTTICTGPATPCPCANQVAGAGCRNGTGQGGLLSALGSNSVFSDDLQLSASGVGANVPGIFFMGSANGPVNLLGNGARCVQGGGGPVFRFPVQFATAGGVIARGPGIAAFANANFTPPLGAIQAGSTRYFQVWYRDATGPCGQGSNLTSGVGVVFSP